MKTQVGGHAPRFDDDVRDHKGRRYCACGRREDHQMHQLPPAPAEARQRDSAVLGEHEEN